MVALTDTYFSISKLEPVFQFVHRSDAVAFSTRAHGRHFSDERLIYVPRPEGLRKSMQAFDPKDSRIKIYKYVFDTKTHAAEWVRRIGVGRLGRRRDNEMNVYIDLV